MYQTTNSDEDWLYSLHSTTDSDMVYVLYDKIRNQQYFTSSCFPHNDDASAWYVCHYFTTDVCYSVPQIFVRPTETRQQADEAKMRFAHAH